MSERDAERAMIIEWLKGQIKHNRQRARGEARMPGGPIYRAVWQERLEHTEYLIEQIKKLPYSTGGNDAA